MFIVHSMGRYIFYTSQHFVRLHVAALIDCNSRTCERSIRHPQNCRSKDCTSFSCLSRYSIKVAFIYFFVSLRRFCRIFSPKFNVQSSRTMSSAGPASQPGRKSTNLLESVIIYNCIPLSTLFCISLHALYIVALSSLPQHSFFMNWSSFQPVVCSAISSQQKSITGLLC